MLAKIIDNFQLRIDRIHIRYEDHSSCRDRPFCAGIILEKLHLYSPSDASSASKGDSIAKVIDKKVKLEGLGVYWDYCEKTQADASSFLRMRECMEVPFVSRSIPEALQCYLPHHFVLAPISLSLQLHIDFRKSDLRKPLLSTAIQNTVSSLPWCSSTPQLSSLFSRALTSVLKDGKKTQESAWSLYSAYLASHSVSPLDSASRDLSQAFFLSVWNQLNTVLPMVEVDADMRDFSVRLDKQQYRDALELTSSLSVQTLKAKYRRFMPKDGCTTGREWWRFTIRSVVYNNQRHRRHSGWKHYLQFKRQREEYIELYPKKDDPAVLMRLRRLEDKLSLENILLFRRVALNEMEEKKKKKKVLSRKGRKSLESSLRSTEEAAWSEARRQELLAEFDINPEEPSLWEEGQALDRQVSIKFHLHKLGLCLTQNDKKLVACKLRGLEVQYLKRKQAQQVWCCMNEIILQDEVDKGGKWRRILYPQQAASTSQRASFLPQEMVSRGSVPFLQLELQAPALDGKADVFLQGRSLPLCVVGNTKCIMEIVDFIVPELTSLNVYAFKQKEYPLFRERGEKKRRFDISRELSKHRVMELNVELGAVHVIIPERVTEEQCQVLVLRLGDVVIHSSPQGGVVVHSSPQGESGVVQVESGVEKEKSDSSTQEKNDSLTQDKAYDTLTMGLRNITAVLTTNHESNDDLSIIQSFSIEAIIGRSITPSELELPTVRVDLAMPTVLIELNQTQYNSILQWLQGFTEATLQLLEGKKDTLSGLSQAASQFMDNMFTEMDESEKAKMKAMPIEEKRIPYSEEELFVLQHNRILELRAVLSGCRIRLQEECVRENALPASHGMVEFVIGEVEFELQKRSLDFSVHASLKEFCVIDHARSLLASETQYLVLSKPIDEQGRGVEEQHALMTVDFHRVKELSLDYPQSKSDRDVQVQFGALSGEWTWLDLTCSGGVSTHAAPPGAVPDSVG